GSTPPGSTTPALTPDRYETNNTWGAAKDLHKLTSLNVTGLTLHSATDVDYYKFAAGSTGTYSVSAAFAQAGATGGSLGLTVMDDHQVVLASGQSSTGNLVLSFGVVSGRHYYLKVASPTAGLFSYSVTIGVPSGGGGAR